MSTKTYRRVFIVFSSLMAFAMISSAIIPALSRNVGQTRTEDATPVPTATPFPMPDDLSAVTFDDIYLHSSGLLTVAQPPGWIVSSETNDAYSIKVQMHHPQYLTIIDAYVEKPSVVPETPEMLDAYFTEAVLNNSWSSYTSWEEMGVRRIEDDQLIIDFQLMMGNSEYISRHIAWTEGEWIYVVRAVTPQIGRDLLLHLIDGLIPTLHVNEELTGTPLAWSAYFDSSDKHILRFPQNWTLADEAPGLPASIEGMDGVVLRVEAQEGAVADADEALSWVETSRSGIEALDVEELEQGGFSGFAVSYSYTTVDGERQSGLAVLLNGPQNKLHVANLRLRLADVNFHSDEAHEVYAILWQVMDSFRLMPDLDVVGTGSAS